MVKKPATTASRKRTAIPAAKKAKPLAGKPRAAKPGNEASNSERLGEIAARNTLAVNPWIGIRARDFGEGAQALLGAVVKQPVKAVRHLGASAMAVGRAALGRGDAPVDPRTDPDAIKLFTDHARGGHPTGYRYQMLALLGWTSLPWLWRIKHPTLVMAGNDDPLVPLINARLHAWLLPDARLHVFEDGHLFLLTRARQATRILAAFLAEPARR